MTSLQERLFAMQDKQYAAFQAKLTPGVPVESFIGIRVPVLRKFAKEFTKEADCEEFLHQLPHEYYDENMLHGLLISEVKDYEECICLTDRFLPFVDNWAVCDIMSPKVQDTSTYYVWIGGSCDYGHKKRAGGAALVIEHKTNKCLGPFSGH